jgi:hypothetical protein
MAEMKHAITQVPSRPWPSGYGEIMAMIDVPLDHLVRSHALELFDGTNNLGDYRAAVVQLGSGRVLGLARHDGHPEQGTEVHADVNDDPHAAITELLHTLDLSEKLVTWLRESSPAERRG